MSNDFLNFLQSQTSSQEEDYSNDFLNSKFGSASNTEGSPKFGFFDTTQNSNKNLNTINNNRLEAIDEEEGLDTIIDDFSNVLNSQKLSMLSQKIDNFCEESSQFLNNIDDEMNTPNHSDLTTKPVKEINNSKKLRNDNLNITTNGNINKGNKIAFIKDYSVTYEKTNKPNSKGHFKSINIVQNSVSTSKRTEIGFNSEEGISEVVSNLRNARNNVLDHYDDIGKNINEILNKYKSRISFISNQIEKTLLYEYNLCKNNKEYNKLLNEKFNLLYNEMISVINNIYRK